MAQDQAHQAVEVRNLSRDPEVAERAIRYRPKANSVLFSRDQQFATKLLDIPRGIMMMVPKTNRLYRLNSNRFQRSEESFGFRDSRKSDNGPVLKVFSRDRLILFI